MQLAQNLFFFFSSRRRHTRYWRDWSSDVCSSDLCAAAGPPRPRRTEVTAVHGGLLGAAYLAGSSPVHRLEPHLKLVAVLGFALVVVATPVHAPWAWAAYGGYLALVLLAAAVAGVRPARLARGLAIEVPFVLFALLLPFVAKGPRVEVAGLALSESGLVAAGGLLAKATLSVLAAVVLSATTEPRALLAGLERLRLPSLLVQILMFMIRYADVVGGELTRMRVARESRGVAGRNLSARSEE